MDLREDSTPAENLSTFRDLGLLPELLHSLDTLHYLHPTPIQEQSIPIVIAGKDMVGIAQTGTGKTLAYGLPMVQRLKGSYNQALVLVPTRELALQVEAELKKIGASIRLKTAVLIGGANIRPQLQALRNDPHIIIATPGRLIDHMEQHTLDLARTSLLVLDEADRMLDMGFQPQMKKILHAVPKERQTLLFSATLSPDIMTIATKHMKIPVRIEIAPAGTTAERVTQEIFFVKREEKPRLIEKLLLEYQGSTLVFTKTKHMAKRLTRVIQAMGHGAAEIHGNKSLGQRIDALQGFKSGKYRVLVATDIAARGIDVKDVQLVVNYDLPTHSEDYVHRIGRTARAGAHGHAISFVLPEERHHLRSIERLIRKNLEASTLPELPPARTLIVSHETSVRFPRDARRSFAQNRSYRKPFSHPRRTPHAAPSRRQDSRRPHHSTTENAN